MTTTRFANNASTTLGSSASPTDTTLTVASGTGAQFPAITGTQYFMATLFASATGMPNEIVKVTARVGDTMTVVRGQEGTTAQAWSVGDHFENFVTAGFLNSLVDASSLQTQSGNYAADSGTANAGVVTLTPAPANLGALLGVPIRVKKGGATSTGTYTLNVNSLGAVPVLIGGMPLEGGELVANEIYEVVYDGTQFNLISNPGTLHGDRIAPNSVLNAALAVMTALTIKGNLGGSTATPYDIPLADFLTALGFPPFTPDGQTIPLIGGYLLKFGTNRVFHPGEGSVLTTYINPFPTQTLAALSVGYIETPGDTGNDMWTKVSTRTRFGFYTNYGAPSSGNDGHGFDWFALGN